MHQARGYMDNTSARGVTAEQQPAMFNPIIDGCVDFLCECK